MSSIVEKEKEKEMDDDNLAMENEKDQLGDGRLFKMEVDYAMQVDEAIPKGELMAKVDYTDMEMIY